MRNANPAKEHVEEPEGDDNDQDDQVVGQRGGNNRMANRLRNRRRNQVNEEEVEEEDGEFVEGDAQQEIKLSKKDIQKMQKRQEKQRQQEALRQQKEEREQRRLQQEQKEQEEEDKRNEEERLRQEQEAKRKQEIENQEKEEYNQWKDMFTVDEAGDKQEEDAKYENILSAFVDYITIRKVVLFEDVAAEFSMTSKDVIDRIQRLQESGRLQGITDDRGKFIHITDQEYQAVTNYIKTKGRVNKNDLLMESNKLIRL